MKASTGDKFALFIVGLWFVALGGWVANIYKLISTGMVIAEWGGMEIARVVGVLVAPLGAVLGFF